MFPFCIIPVKKEGEALPAFFHGPVFIQVDILILNRSPEAFHKHIIQSTALSIHADFDFIVF
jgi:hypothetical protein